MADITGGGALVCRNAAVPSPRGGVAIAGSVRMAKDTGRTIPCLTNDDRGVIARHAAGPKARRRPWDRG